MTERYYYTILPAAFDARFGRSADGTVFLDRSAFYPHRRTAVRYRIHAGIAVLDVADQDAGMRTISRSPWRLRPMPSLRGRLGTALAHMQQHTGQHSLRVLRNCSASNVSFHLGAEAHIDLEGDAVEARTVLEASGVPMRSFLKIETLPCASKMQPRARIAQASAREGTLRIAG